MQKKKKAKKTRDPVQEILHMGPSETDPQGSYTGKPRNPDDVPVQDSDDL